MWLRKKGVRLPLDYLAVFSLLVAVFWFSHEMIWETKVPFFRDLGLYFYPIRFSLAQSFKAGELPLWDRHIAMGFPLLADFQSATFYPPHLIFLLFPFFDAVRALFVFHYLIAAVGSYMLFRYWTYPVYLSLVGATIFTFGGIIISLANLLNHFQSAVWLPWLILAGERTFRSRRWRDFIGLTGVGLVQFLAGSPEIYVMSSALLFLNAVKTRTEYGSPCGRSFLLIIAANVFVIGLSMLQVLPTVELLLQSRRPGRIPYGEATLWSLNPLYLINVFFLDKEVDANLFTGLRLFFIRDIPFFISYYMGQISLFGVCSWFYYSSRKEKIVLLGGIFTTLILALGRHTPVYFYLFEYVPLLGFIRFPEKYFFLTYILLIFIAIKGLHQFLENENDNRNVPLFIVGLILVFLSTVYVLCRFKPEDFLSLFQRSRLGSDPLPSMLERLPHFLFSLERQMLLLVAVFVLFLLYRRRKISSPIFRALTVILVFMDLASAHRPYQFLFDPESLKGKPRILSAPDSQPYRLFPSLPYLHPSMFTFKQRPFADVIASQWSSLFPNTGIFYGFDYLQETDALGRQSYDFFLRLAKDLPPNRFYPFLGALNVKYISSSTPLPDGEITLLGHFPDYPLWLYRVDRTVPRVYIVSKVEVEKDPLKTLERISNADFDPLKEVILEQGLPNLQRYSVQADKGEANIMDYRNQNVTIQAFLNAPGILVLADSFYPGWRAYVDGKETEILRANLFFRAVPLSPGEHLVEFRYKPASFKIGLTVSLLTLCCLLFLGSRDAKLRKRAGPFV